MAFYESVFVCRPDLSKQDVTRISEELVAIVSRENGKVVKQEYWGLRNLAYKINKNGRGHYVMFYLDAPAAAVAELERNMQINENIIRKLTVRVDAIESKPSVMMLQGRGEEKTAEVA